MNDGGLNYITRPRYARGVVIFLHGLNGHCLASWGRPEHPGAFQHRLAAAFPDTAIGYYDYPSHAERILRDEALTLERLAHDWLKTFRGELLPAFERIGIVHHCIGGLLTRFALRRWMSQAGDDTVRDVRVMLHFLDTPEDWPDKVPSARVRGIMRGLAIDEITLRGCATWWSARSSVAGSVEDHAVISAQDNWITPFKPGSTIPARRVLISNVVHAELSCAPMIGRYPPYDYVAKQLRRHFRRDARQVSHP